MNAIILTVLMSLAHFSVEIVDGGIPLLLPLLKENLSLSHTLAGTIMMFRIFGSSVLQPVFGILTDIRPNKWLLPISALVAAIGVACLGYCPSFLWVTLVAFLAGLGTAAFHPLSTKAIYCGSGSWRASSLAIFSVAGSVGYALGPGLMSLLLHIRGLKGTFYLAVFGVLTASILITGNRKFDLAPEEGVQRGANKTSLVDALSKPVIILTAFTVLRAIVHFGFTTYIPFYYPQPFSGLALTLFLMAGPFGTLLGGVLADRYGIAPTTIWSTVVTIPVCILFMLTSGKWALFFLTMAGFTLFSTMSVTIVMCQDLMPNNIGFASGLMTGFGYGMAGVALIPIGWLADLWGIRAALWGLTLTTLPTTLLAVLAVAPRLSKAVDGAKADLGSGGL